MDFFIVFGGIAALYGSFWWGYRDGRKQGIAETKRTAAEAERQEIVWSFRCSLDLEGMSDASVRSITAALDKAAASKDCREIGLELFRAGKWYGMEAQMEMDAPPNGEGDIRMKKKDFSYIAWLAGRGFEVLVTPLDNLFRVGEQFTEEQAQ